MAIRETEGFVEFNGEVSAVESVAKETALTVQEIMQQAKGDDYGHIRLVGRDEFEGRLASDFSRLAMELKIK